MLFNYSLFACLPRCSKNFNSNFQHFPRLPLPPSEKPQPSGFPGTGPAKPRRSLSRIRSSMEAPADEYAAFQERVRKTVYIDNLSPLVTENILKAAFDQFCHVVNIQFIPNYINPQNVPRAALVETGSASEASTIVNDMANFPLMISGMPRPVRLRAASEGMFDDRPKKPGRKVTFQWLDRNDPNFEVARRIKILTRKHAAEAEFLLERQLGEEEKLAKQQGEILKANYKKYEMIDGVLTDGTANKLACRYGMRLLDA